MHNDWKGEQSSFCNVGAGLKRKENTMKLPRKLTRFTLAWGMLLLAGIPALAAPTITATPATVTIRLGQTSGKTTLTWDAEDNPDAEVWLAVGNVVDEPFAKGAKGTQAVDIELGKTYKFNLYQDGDAQEPLASVIVNGRRAPRREANPPAEGDDVNGEDDGDAALSFTGTWPTLAAGTTEYTVRLQQVDDTVTGSFSPQNGKIFDGVVEGRKLTFKWTQNGGWEGTAEFTMNRDGKGFTGTTTAEKPQQFSHSWNSFVPEPLMLAGVWDTISNDRPFVLILNQEGDHVFGTYTPGTGTIDGTLKGKILNYTWTNDGQEGSGRFIFDKSESAFSGSYSDSDDPDDPAGIWTGNRRMGGGGGKTVPSGGGGKTVVEPADFLGKWNVVAEGGVKWFFNIIQYPSNGAMAKVYGTFYQVNNSSVVFNIKDSYVMRKERMLVFDTTLKTKYQNKVGRFVMNADGKSFTGTYAGTPMTGTLIRK